MITQDALLGALRALGTQVEQWDPNINAGGCAVYAALVARTLTDAGVPAWGVVRNWDNNTPLDKVREKLSPFWKDATDWYRAGTSFNHVLVQFELDGKKYFHDTEGTGETTRSMARIVPGKLTVAELEKLAASPRGWNDWFSRDHIPQVRKYVKSFLGGYLKTALASGPRKAA